MKTQADYEKLQADLRAVEQTIEEAQTGLVYLRDVNVDRENVMDGGTTEDSPEFWDRMYSAAGQSAYSRAEDMGRNINTELGYKVC